MPPHINNVLFHNDSSPESADLLPNLPIIFFNMNRFRCQVNHELCAGRGRLMMNPITIFPLLFIMSSTNSHLFLFHSSPFITLTNGCSWLPPTLCQIYPTIWPDLRHVAISGMLPNWRAQAKDSKEQQVQYKFPILSFSCQPQNRI